MSPVRSRSPAPESLIWNSRWSDSPRGVLFPSLLACFHEFVHVAHRPNLEGVAIGQRWVVGHELHGMIHVTRLEDENAAELLLGFRIWTVGGCHFAVLPRQR